MKIALLTSYMSSATGGLAYSVARSADALTGTSRCNVFIVGVADPRAQEEEKDRPCGDHVFLHTEYGFRGFHWAPGIAATLAALNPDLTDVQGLWLHQSLVNLRRHNGTGHRYLVTPRGMLDPWAMRRSRWKKRLVSWWFEDQHLRRAACLRATARMEADHFRACGLKNPIAIVPNGIDLPQLAARPNAAPSKCRLLFLSRLHPKKGIGHLLRAWKRLQGVHRDWELVIAGPDELGHRAEMQRLVADLGARDVVWHEAVHGEAKAALYRCADIFVLPTHAENFGLVVAEALVHEVPVITTTNAPWDGLERHRCGWWIDLSDDNLVAALDEAMSLSDAERHAMGERGRAWMASDFTWSAVARQMHEVYTWVLGGGPPPACVITD